MGLRQPEDPMIKLARAEERLKNSSQQKKEIEYLSQELKKITAERHKLHEDLEKEKLKVEIFEIASKKNEERVAEKNKETRWLTNFSDILFLVANIFIGWGVNYISSTPRNDTGLILIGAGVIIFILGIFLSRKIASGGAG
jgi:cell division protein FtsB